MGIMQDSTAEARDGLRRFFAWTFVVSALLMFAMIALEVFFPQGVRIAPQSSAVLADTLGTTIDVDLYDFQLLIMVGALVSCVASIVGLVIVAVIDSVESRKARRRRAIEARLQHPTGWHGQESPSAERPPARNAGLRELRQVVHDLK
jgi:hypothetical protein